MRSDLHAYLGGISNNLDCPALDVGGVEDHVHLLVRGGRKIAQADWVREVKKGSSSWIKERYPNLKDFAWQSGYGVFSVGVREVPAVRAYIQNQIEHHKKMSFQDEYRQILKEFGIDVSEEYLWD